MAAATIFTTNQAAFPFFTPRIPYRLGRKLSGITLTFKRSFLMKFSEPNKIAFETITSQDVTIDGTTHKCLVAVYPIKETPLVKEGTAKKTGKPYKILHAIEPYYLTGAGLGTLEGEFTITFQASRFHKERVQF